MSVNQPQSPWTVAGGKHCWADGTDVHFAGSAVTRLAFYHYLSRLLSISIHISQVYETLFPLPMTCFKLGVTNLSICSNLTLFIEHFKLNSKSSNCPFMSFHFAFNSYLFILPTSYGYVFIACGSLFNIILCHFLEGWDYGINLNTWPVCKALGEQLAKDPKSNQTNLAFCHCSTRDKNSQTPSDSSRDSPHESQQAGCPLTLAVTNIRLLQRRTDEVVFNISCRKD